MEAKKKKRTKYQPLELTNFKVVAKSSWADDDSDTPLSDINALREKLPTAPKAVRNAYDISQLPSTGPWKAKVNNLPFNVKEEDVIKFLGGESEIATIDIPYNGNRMRGYAIVTFVNREALANGLSKNDDMLMNRRISVNLGSEDGHFDDNSSPWGRNRDDTRRSIRDDDEGDWRSSAIQSREETIGRQERSSPANGDWSRGPVRRGWQDEDSRSRRFDGRGGFDKFESSDRDSGPRREWTRDSDRSDYRDRDRDRRDRPSTFERDTRDRPGDYGQSDGRYDRSEPQRERTRLVLKPRSKPLEVSTGTKENGKEQPNRSSIFGDAKPVDTASKEREIESRIERDRAVSSDFPRRRFQGSESSLTDKDETPSQTPGAQRPMRSRKTSDSSGQGKIRGSSSNTSPGLPVKHGNDFEPASPPPYNNDSSNSGYSDSSLSNNRRQQKTPGGAGMEDEDIGGESRNRRSSASGGEPSQPTVQVVDAPPPTVNVWQVRRSQMQKRAEAAAVNEPDSAAAARVSASVNNSNATATATMTNKIVPNQSDVKIEESSNTSKPASSVEEQSIVPDGDNTTVDHDHEKEERVAATSAPTQSQQPKRPPVVVSVSAAQRAAAEGQPPPPPIHENAWQNAQAGMDSVRRPPSPVRMGSGNQTYSSERSYQYQGHHSHSGHNDWQDSGARMQRNDYRDSGNYRGSGGYRGGGNRGGWRGRGGPRSGYRGRGRGGYRFGGEPGSADM